MALTRIPQQPQPRAKAVFHLAQAFQLTLATSLTTSLALPTSASDANDTIISSDHLPEVSVEEHSWSLSTIHSASSQLNHSADSAEVLWSVPGAAVNRNGGLTGLAQYRGLSGDRIHVTIDGASIVTGGPNAMDAPLSYVPAAMLDTLEVTRGIASVSQGQETLGGHINARRHLGAFTQKDEFELQARLNSDWQSQNQGSQSSLQLITANQNHKLGISGNYDQADDGQFKGGSLDTSEYERRRYDAFYGYQHGDNQVTFTAGKNNTGRSGTPALAMDITAIDSDLASLEWTGKLGDVSFSWNSSYSNVFHAMDNFSLRPQPMMGARETLADGRQITHKIMFGLPYNEGLINVGADYSDSQHSATVTNPDMPLFEINNFNHATRSITGLFAEWQQQNGDWRWEAGARLNHVDMDADEVGAFFGMGTMGMMNMTMMTNMAGMLALNFNHSDRSETYHNRDLVLKGSYQLHPSVRVHTGLSSKQRAPSYQERYLWLPMQSTGGLADGHTYIGNLDLDSETATELNAGFDYTASGGFVSLQLFYREVDDYIQGVPYTSSGMPMTDNAVAMFAAMMSGGNPPLQYANIDARLFGGELSYGYQFSNHWSLAGTLSYVRGKRTDEQDDLYRLAPLNHRLALTYTDNHWQLQLVSEVFDRQNRVSHYNSETTTPGYGLLHLFARYAVNDNLQLRAGIDNLADKRYQNHLAGYNRVGGNEDIAVGERLYGSGRSAVVGATWIW